MEKRPPTIRNTMQLQEYLLQGSILEMHRDVLLHRLNGLCDTVDTGPEKFHDHEQVWALRGHANNPAVVLRVRKALDHADAPWHMRYVGTDLGDRTRHTLVRDCIDCGCSDSVVQFLTEMGFKLDHEFIVRGYLFRKGRMKITVSKLFKMQIPGNVTDNIEPLTSSYLVELSVVAPLHQEQIQDDMKSFAEQLKPLVQLEKVDHRKLQMNS